MWGPQGPGKTVPASMAIVKASFALPHTCWRARKRAKRSGEHVGRNAGTGPNEKVNRLVGDSHPFRHAMGKIWGLPQAKCAECHSVARPRRRSVCSLGSPIRVKHRV